MERNTNFQSELEAELESEFELDSESDNEYELDSEMENEFEYEDSNGRSYESRIQQLLSRSGDNELEFNQELNQVIYDMEQEFFFKGLKRPARRGLQKFKSIAGRTPLGQIRVHETFLKMYEVD